MKRVLVLVGLIGIAFTSAAYAGESSGCGLGQTFFKGQSGLVPNVLAATTNGTSGNNTFGMTSGTSGCKADSVVLKEKEQEAFVATNLEALNQEMAQGQGQHVMALASLMGCSTAVQGEFASMTQASYGTVFANADTSATVVLASLKSEMGRSPVLASSCGRIS